MKRIILSLIAMLAVAATFAQAPQGFTYQAAVRNNDGTAVANQQVNVRISLVQGSALGVERYAELHTPTTDAAGLFTIVVGQGTGLVNCMMADCIDWANGPWFLKTQIDPDGGQNFSLSTTQQLMSVPYALFAANVAHDTVHIRDSVVVHIIDSVIVHHRDSIIYDTIDTWSYDSHPADIIGALPGVFSISPANRIAFSKGNLQYKASTGTWRFAEHQWDIVGTANAHIAADDTLWIDLFGYGASGYSNKYPYTSSTDQAAYPTGPIATTEYDWGVHNAISNGGDSAGMWRTLSGNEWYYIIHERPNASSLCAAATVAGIPGLVLLPDNWTAVPGIAVDVVTTGYNANVFSVTQWNSLQDNGAVFLPAAGKRSGITMANVGTQCCYWSSYYSSGNGAYRMLCTESGIVQFNYASTIFGHSVRLVHDLTVLP